MSIRVFDFVCPEGHSREHFIDSDCLVVNCATCGAPAQRALPATRCKLESISGHFPGATMSWERGREQKMARDRKLVASRGEDSTGHIPGEYLGNTIGRK